MSITRTNHRLNYRTDGNKILEVSLLFDEIHQVGSLSSLYPQEYKIRVDNNNLAGYSEAYLPQSDLFTIITELAKIINNRENNNGDIS